MKKTLAAVLVVLVASGSSSALGPTAQAFLGSPTTFPGENGRIAVLGECENQLSGLVTMRPDGSDRRCIVSTLDVEGRTPYGPIWSPDGLRLAFAAGGTDLAEIYTVRSDGTDLQRLTDNNVIDRLPTWSPSGDRIMFTRRNRATFVMDSDGTDVELVERDADEPAWSPDGRKIVFVWGLASTNNRQIWTVNLDGSKRTPLTRGTRFSGAPTWSPDGRRIVFVRGSAGSLTVMRRDGSRLRELAHRAQVVKPVWSPDGRVLLMERGNMLSKFRLNTRRFEDVTGSEGDVAPDWQAD